MERREGGAQKAREGRGGCAEGREGARRGKGARRKERRGFSSRNCETIPGFPKIIYELYIIYF